MDPFWRGLRYFFDTVALNPHGICLLWRPELIWTHAISDLVIGLAYFSIPLAMAVFLRGRPDVRFSWAIWMFVAFILLCGVTHFMMIWTLWNPDYGIEALIKAATAVVSLVTAIALWPLLPKAIALPSTSTLQAHIAERDAALADLRAALETMVEMRDHDARQKLLLDELNHRVKNTLAVVQSMAAQTFRNTGDLAGARDAFTQRLMALSSTHNILVERAWEGANLRALVAETLQPYGQPYSYAGVDLGLDANLAVSMGMAFHELATNALKHGAWNGDGAVAITVAPLDDSRIQIVWQETGGPPVVAPDRTGFGTRLLSRGLAGELSGEVSLDFAATGLVCTIRVPLSHRLRLLSAASG